MEEYRNTKTNKFMSNAIETERKAYSKLFFVFLIFSDSEELIGNSHIKEVSMMKHANKNNF